MFFFLMETPRKTVKLWGSDSFKAEPEKTEGNKNISFLHLQCFIPKGTCHVQIPSIKNI